MRRILSAVALACAIAAPASAAIVWTCTVPAVSVLESAYLATTVCTSDAGTYTTTGDCLGVGCAATAASAGAVLCGSNARQLVSVLASGAAPAAGTTGNPVVYDQTNFKLQLFESGAANAALAEKTGAEAVTASSVVKLLAFCK